MSPNECFRDVPIDIIVIDQFWVCWTLTTCSNMPYTTCIPTIVCLGWPLAASRSPNEPKSVFSGCPQSDIIVIDYFWACWTLPTYSNMPYTTCIPTSVCFVWPAEAFRGPQRPKMSPNECFKSDFIVIAFTTSGEVSHPL